MKKIGVIGEISEIPESTAYSLVKLDQTNLASETELDLCIVNLKSTARPDRDKKLDMLTQLIRTQLDIKILAIVDSETIAAKEQILAGKQIEKSDVEWLIALYLINMFAFLVESISVEKVKKILNSEIEPYSLMMRSSVVFQLPNNPLI